jgi:hypothetical protein
MALGEALTKLDEIGRHAQDKDAAEAIATARREIIDALRLDPGVGAVIEVQFLEPEHRFQDVRWRRTTDAYYGKPTRVLNEANRQPVSTFIVVQPTRQAPAASDAAAPPRKVASAKEFIAAYMTARGADLATTGTVAIEMHDAIARGRGAFGWTDVTVGTTTLRISDSDRGPIQSEIAAIAEKAVRKRLNDLNGEIAAQQERVAGRAARWFGGNVTITGHELDRARAHHAAAAGYLRDGKYGPALESIKAGEEQVKEVFDTLYEDTHGRRPD